MFHFASIVEGHGDVEALPILIRRAVQLLKPGFVFTICPPIRLPKGKIINKPDELKRSVELAARKTNGSGAILVVLDADADCPYEQGPKILSLAQAQRSNLPIKVVLAKREFETWYIAAIQSLQGQRGLPTNIVAPTHPEEIENAKSWLESKMSASYGETVDQPAFASLFDLKEAQKSSPSFAKFMRDIKAIVDVHSGVI